MSASPWAGIPGMAEALADWAELRALIAAAGDPYGANVFAQSVCHTIALLTEVQP